MPFLTLLTDLTFYHISLLTLLLGAQLYQSFLANITASAALTRAQFRILQAAIWPMYFKLQMVVSVLLALTYPGGDGALFHGSASVRGLFDGDGKDRVTALLPLGMMFVFSAANVVFVAPRTIRMMWKLQLESVREEKARGNTSSSESLDDDNNNNKNNFESVRDRKTIREDGSKSPELRALTHKFLAFHGASYVCNMATIAASVCYALCIAVRVL